MLMFDTDRTKDGQNDDRDLEKAMINAVKSAKAWAQRGSEKLKDSIEPSLISSTKTAIKPLLNKDNKYADNAKQVAGESPSSWSACAELPNTYRPCFFLDR
jgi:hypothetical protein